MKNVLLFSLVLLFSVACVAQNLVSNPGFNRFRSCPVGGSKLDSCKYWRNPTLATPDYFHACHDTMPGFHYVGVPVNNVGIQDAADSAYIGLGTMTTSSSNIREYAGTDIPPLMVGAVYRVMLKISTAESSYYATHAPSVFFYKDMVGLYQLSQINLPYIPQVTYEKYGFINATLSWVTVADTFVADSAYAHLIIGNFGNDAATAKMVRPATGLMGGDGYYYIDSVSVEKIGEPTMVKTNEMAAIKAVLYPNPFSVYATLRIENSGGLHCTLSIVNVQGAEVSRVEDIRSREVVISRNGLAPGVYFCELRGAGKVVWRDKMIVY